MQVEQAIEENVGFLKRKHVIALAQEYKKAKDDLARTKIRMVKVRIDRDNILRAAKEIEGHLVKAKEDYGNVLKGSDNVLSFRKKDAKK